MSLQADTGPGQAGAAVAAAPAKAFSLVLRATVGQSFSFSHDQVAAMVGLVWPLVRLAAIHSMISAEVASTAVRLQEASSGGAHGARQV